MNHFGLTVGIVSIFFGLISMAFGYVTESVTERDIGDKFWAYTFAIVMLLSGFTNIFLSW